MSIDFRHASALNSNVEIDQNCRYHPFKEDSQVLSFSELPEVKDIRKKVSENLESNNSMQVICGEQGIGKTMLLRTVSLSRRLNCQKITGNNGLTVVNLFKKLSTAIDAPLGSLKSAPIEHINFFVKNFKAQEKPLCVMVDDAELLPLQTLAALIHCNNKILQEGREDFTVALFGKPELNNKISPLLSDDDKLDTDFYEIKRLSEESIVHYIYTKLRHAGWQGALPIISNQELKSIKKNSSGIPKNINHVISHHYYDDWNKNWQQGINRIASSPAEIQQASFKIIAVLAITSILAWIMITPSMAIYKGGWTNLTNYYVDTSNSLVEKATTYLS